MEDDNLGYLFKFVKNVHRIKKTDFFLDFGLILAQNQFFGSIFIFLRILMNISEFSFQHMSFNTPFDAFFSPFALVIFLLL